MDDLQALLDQQEGYQTPPLESYIQTPKKQAEKQSMMDAVVAALRGQAGDAAAPVIGAGMGGAAMPAGNVVSANAGLSQGINQGVNLGTDFSKALRTPTASYSAPADLAGTSFI